MNHSPSNLRNTLQRRKEKEVFERGFNKSFNDKSTPSTLSFNKTKKKLLTVEELYVEVLYTVLHMIGCDIDQVGRINLK